MAVVTAKASGSVSRIQRVRRTEKPPSRNVVRFAGTSRFLQLRNPALGRQAKGGFKRGRPDAARFSSGPLITAPTFEQDGSESDPSCTKVSRGYAHGSRHRERGRLTRFGCEIAANRTRSRPIRGN